MPRIWGPGQSGQEAVEVQEMQVLLGHFRPFIRPYDGCSGTYSNVPDLYSNHGGPLAPALACTCWPWLNTRSMAHLGFTFSSGSAFGPSRNRVSSPLPRPVPSSLLQLSSRTSSTTPSLRAKIHFLPPSDLLSLGSIPVALLSL